VRESKETRLVWITLLALKDENGKVFSSVVGLADIAKVTVKECREALEKLKAPDPEDTSKVEEGRRIREMPGGWEIINNDRYRYSTEERRERWRLQKQLQREREASAKAAAEEAEMQAAFPGGDVGLKDVVENVESGKIIRKEKL
jgi:hypothetical protein